MNWAGLLSKSTPSATYRSDDDLASIVATSIDRLDKLIGKGANKLTITEDNEKEIRKYLISLTVNDGEELVRKLTTIEGKKQFEEFLMQITQKGHFTISDAVNSAINFTVPPTQGNDQEYVINEIILKLSKYLKVRIL